MLTSVLIANRGEIACRVIRTARRMGLRTIAVFSEADAQALHVTLADEAYPIGPAPARDSYLDVDRVLDAARRSGAASIHPGYGFLSENADFAEACGAAGVVFIGPPPAAIRAMGSKSAAKALMERAGVPLVPGYHGTEQEPTHLRAQADAIGYPVLIKASAGGGGKGMRVVEAASEFAEALALARGEARSSFGDDQVLIERYLTRPRHIEIQVFADSHGQVASLFERDCSIQRRHQKVVEEAPAPGMDPARRAAMGEAACNAARAIGYVGAGTVEFIVEGDDFYFMEMNTRLQVEHPVTEFITGLDLVEWQLRVASGEKLPTTAPSITGHAIEVRVYAEDPARDFMPSIGRLVHLRQPREGPHVRVDTGVCEGDAISVHYDPMIAKLIVWDHDRAGAVLRLQRALQTYEVVGVQTNLGLLRAIVGSVAFGAAELDTRFIARHASELLPASGPAPLRLVAAAAATYLSGLATSPDGEDAHSPWNLKTAWRLNGAGYQDITLLEGGISHAVRLVPPDIVSVDGHDFTVSPGDSGGWWLDGVRSGVAVVPRGGVFSVVERGQAYDFTLHDPFTPPASQTVGGDQLTAPMPGRIIELMAAPGDLVTRGQVLVVLEAMKVQMRLVASRDATLSSVHVRVGTLVRDGELLVRFDPVKTSAND